MLQLLSIVVLKLSSWFLFPTVWLLFILIRKMNFTLLVIHCQKEISFERKKKQAYILYQPCILHKSILWYLYSCCQYLASSYHGVITAYDSMVFRYTLYADHVHFSSLYCIWDIMLCCNSASDMFETLSK